MKRTVLALIMALVVISAFAQTPKYVYTEASELTMFGKLMPGMTSNPYHRVDTTRYTGFTRREAQLVTMSSGMGCVFKTNSKSISISVKYNYKDDHPNTSDVSTQGFDLYIRQDGKWLWAAAGPYRRVQPSKPFVLIENMDGSEHECLLYFPTYSELKSVKVGVEKGSEMSAVENPFKHRIAIWGSSYTHGSSTSRAGMTYPAQFSRSTGLQMLSLGTSGTCRLQDYFCDVLVDVQADAFVFDTFSNSSASMIHELLVPFIDRMIDAHPGKPMIFQQTIYRERRNFNVKENAREKAKMEAAEEVFAQMKSTPAGQEKYKDVYLIYPSATSETHEATVDGVHPDNYGYTLWAKSIEQPILDILEKYGIRK